MLGEQGALGRLSRTPCSGSSIQRFALTFHPLQSGGRSETGAERRVFCVARQPASPKHAAAGRASRANLPLASQMSSPPRSYITVVSGLPRSGTSMMMQMLVSGGIPAITDGIRRADDDNQRGYYELEAVKRTKDDSSWLQEAPGKVVKLIYRLLYDLPPDYEYRVVFLNRHLDEVLASQQTMLQRRGEQGATVSQDQLRRIFSDQLDKVRGWLDQQSSFGVLYVDYHLVLAEPVEQSERISNFLGGLDVASMAAAVAPSLYRQRSNSS